MSKFEKITNVRLPFDRRHDEPYKNYGIKGLDVWFVLKGAKGAVQFAVSFPTYLPHVTREAKVKGWFDPEDISGIDVGYHAKKPQYKSQTSMKCDYLGECYYDGSGLLAQEWADEIFSITGENPENEIWRRLEQEYLDLFGGSEKK